MGKRERRISESPAELNMTAMIDVVFQLLIFFLVTQKPQDTLANLDVFRPSPEKKQEQLQTPPKMIRVQIYPDGFTINDRPVGAEELDNLLRKLASHLRMIHAHDNRGQSDEHLPPGDGSIDWLSLLRQFAQANFQGALILEMAGKADAHITMENARRGRSYLREISRRLVLGEHAVRP